MILFQDVIKHSLVRSQLKKFIEQFTDIKYSKYFGITTTKSTPVQFSHKLLYVRSFNHLEEFYELLSKEYARFIIPVHISRKPRKNIYVVQALEQIKEYIDEHNY